MVVRCATKNFDAPVEDHQLLLNHDDSSSRAVAAVVAAAVVGQTISSSI